MEIKRGEAKKLIVEKLSKKFGAREATWMARILLEDKYTLLDEIQVAAIDKDCTQLEADYPIQYLVGKTFFYEGYFKVNQYVLIPRPETEELVHKVLQDISSKECSVFEVGVGSGCISISLAKNRPHWKISAIDISHEAIEVAKFNNKQYGTGVDIFQCDFLETKNWNTLPNCDCIISNPPYIKYSDEIDLSVVKHEPMHALYAMHKNHLVFYEMLAMYMRTKNVKLGYFELNANEAEKIKDLFSFANAEIIYDLQQKPRILKVVNH